MFDIKNTKYWKLLSGLHNCCMRKVSKAFLSNSLALFQSYNIRHSPPGCKSYESVSSFILNLNTSFLLYIILRQSVSPHHAILILISTNNSILSGILVCFLSSDKLLWNAYFQLPMPNNEIVKNQIYSPFLVII